MPAAHYMRWCFVLFIGESGCHLDGQNWNLIIKITDTSERELKISRKHTTGKQIPLKYKYSGNRILEGYISKMQSFRTL